MFFLILQRITNLKQNKMKNFLSFLGFDAASMTIRKEVIGGITTFLTMAYILAVNPDILSATGMDKGAVFTTTCISAVVGTIVMALYAKLPSSPSRWC